MEERMTGVSSICAGAFLAFAALPAWANPFGFTTVINPTDPNFTQLLGINNAGTIAGYFGDGVVVPNNGFILTLPNTFTPANVTGVAQTVVQTQQVGIN